MTCRSDRDVYSALSAWPWLLFQGRSWRKTRGFRERRSFVISIFEHWKSTDRFFFVCLWKMNSHAKWSWMCVLCCKQLFFCQSWWKVCYFTHDIFIDYWYWLVTLLLSCHSFLLSLVNTFVSSVWYPSFCLAFFVPSPLLGSLHFSWNQIFL